MSDNVPPTRRNPSEPESRSEQMEDATRHKRQLEILNHFGTIDFDPDYEPLRLREADRQRMKRLLANRP